MLARKHPEHAEELLDRRERTADRLLWRRLRRPLRAFVLRRIERGHEDERTVRWFRRVRDLEFFAGVRAAGGVPKPRPVRVLCYHAIADLKGTAVLEEYGVPAGDFRRQLHFLVRHFNLVDGGEFVRSLRGAGLPSRPVLLTFDDCTRDLLETALPALREYDAPAVAFAVSGRLGGTNEWDREIGAPELEVLDAEGLIELSRSGIEIGTHTRTHPMLDRLSDDEIRAEIEGSIDDLERAGLPRPTLLAYPHGASDRRVREGAAAAGLAGAFSTRPGLARSDGDPFAIPRIEILRRNCGAFFWLKVVTGRRLRKP
jgi:peptidoglycan/xylan/chitin deacetylase (PgdA/CDA1 family)